MRKPLGQSKKAEKARDASKGLRALGLPGGVLVVVNEDPKILLDVEEVQAIIQRIVELETARS
jgi:hypothetical protein